MDSIKLSKSPKVSETMAALSFVLMGSCLSRRLHKEIGRTALTDAIDAFGKPVRLIEWIEIPVRADPRHAFARRHFR